MTASVLQAVCTINGVLPEPPNPPINNPTATFSIARFDNHPDAELIAPVDIWFGPTNISGFVGLDGQPIVEPALTSAVYDPTQHLVFWSWDFPDEGYVPRFTPNIPASMRGLNKARAKRPCHVFTAPGEKLVRLFGFDTAGNWGTAEYRFGPGGNAPAIIDPNGGVFAGRDFYFSQDNIFPAEVPLADRFTTVAALNSRLVSLVSSANNDHQMFRIRLRRGEVYTDLGTPLGSLRKVYFDAYGDPAAPPPKQLRTHAYPTASTSNAGFFAVSNQANFGSGRIIDQDWEGPYDATTETGRRYPALMAAGSARCRRLLVHRCHVSGLRDIEFGLDGGEKWRTLSDTTITNWQNYGATIYGQEATATCIHNIAFLGTDIFQHPNALSGVNQGGSSSNPADLGNRHGCCRNNTYIRNFYIAASSWFNRCGWSLNSPAGGQTIQPTSTQLCYRYGDTGAASPVLAHHFIERSSFESGDAGFGVVSFGKPSDTYVPNFVFDGNLFVASSQSNTSANGHIVLQSRGVTVRNNMFVNPAATIFNGGAQARTTRAVFVQWIGAAPSVTGPTTIFIYNNTWHILGTNAQVGAATRTFSVVEPNFGAPNAHSNILHAPNLTAAQSGPLPLSSSPIAGFVPRYLGERWSYPPQGGETFQSRVITEWREQPGNPGVLEPGPIANGEWMFYPYPDYTGFCRGAGRQVVRADVDNPTRYHQFSWSASPARDDIGGSRAASSASAGDLRDLVEFAYTDTGVRVRNKFGVTISSGSGWLMLDLPTMRMPMDTSRATPPTDMLWLIPAAGSAGRVPNRTLPWPGVDIGGTARAGMRQSGSVVTPEGVNFAGALAAVPA